MNIDPKRPLRRSTQDYMLAGVCGGIAQWLEWDSTLVRVLYVLALVLLAGFPGIVAYVIAWLIVPPDDR